MSPINTQPSGAVADLVEQVHLGPRQAYKSLTIWPLLRPAGTSSSGPAYVPLADALADGTFVIEELAGGGSVPEVLARNLGKLPVLVLFGEHLRGAKQDRIANASFLIEGGRETTLDVSCVEHGRWGQRSASSRAAGRSFQQSEALSSHALRRRVGHHVTMARAVGERGFRSDQGDVWDHVAQRVEFSNASSSTGAYADYVETRATDLDEMRRAFHAISGQIGFVAGIGDEIAGAELIGRTDVFASCFERLVDSYAIDAVDAAQLKEPLSSAAPIREPEVFLEDLARAEVLAAPSLGLGRDLRLRGERVEGCALDADGIVHLTAYAKIEAAPRSRARRRMRRPDGV